MSKSDISDFVMQPLHKKLNRQNIISRLENLEAGSTTTPRPSARVHGLGEMAQSTGSLIVDELIVVNHDTGERNVILDSDGIVIRNVNDADDSFMIFRRADGSTIGQIRTTVNEHLEVNAFGTTDSGGRKLSLRAQIPGFNDATIELFADANGTGIDQIYIAADEVIVGSSQTGRANLKIDPDFQRVEIREFGTAVHIFEVITGGRVYINYPQLDIDTSIAGTTDASLTYWDAGLNAVSMGGAADAAYKLKVHGTMQATGGIKPTSATTDTVDFAVLGSAFSITSTDFQDTGLSVTLPAAGTYMLYADPRAALRPNGGAGTTTWWISVELYNATDAAAVANSERLAVLTTTNSQLFQTTCHISIPVTVTEAKTIHLYAARDGNGTPAWTTTTIDSNAAGRTTLTYQLVSK